jgi:hypothetical protein
MVNCWRVGVVVAILMAGTATAYVNYEYYEGTWEALPNFDSLTPKHTGLASNFNISPRDQDDNFAFRFRATITISLGGDYSFYTVSDDGSQLFINDNLVVDNDGLHGLQQRSGQVHLDAGQHSITVTYFEKSGGNELYVLYEGPGIAKQALGAYLLSPIEVPAGRTAFCPFPTPNAVVIDTASSLTWMAPTLVANPKYTVYFDADPNFPKGPQVSGLTGTVYDPVGSNPMKSATRYFWRVDVVEPNATVRQGESWNFMTRYGQVAWYPFDVDPNDSTGNGHGGTYKGINDPNIIQDPYRGKVLLLNVHGQADQQYVEVGPVGISGNTARTIAGWARATTTTIPAWTNVFGFAQDGSGDNTYFDVEINGSGQYVLHVFGWEGLFGPVDTQWHHFAATYDGVLLNLYLDGRRMGSEVRGLATIDAFRIGSRRSHKTYFPGAVDDVAIWDYALTAEQVRELMLFADFNRDKQVDTADLRLFADQWLDSTVIPNSIKSPIVLEDFEKYSPTGFPPITMGWFMYLSDSKLSTYTSTLLTGQPGPYGGDKAMRFDFSYPAWQGDDWLTMGHRLSPFKDLKGYDQLRFRVKYHSSNTKDVGLYIHVGDSPPGVTEREAVRAGPFSIVDDVNDPNQWHEIVVDLRNNPNLQWQSPYTSVDGIRYMNAVLFSVVNSTKEARHGSLFFDDFRIVDFTPDCNGLPAADLTGDCRVDLSDFVFLAQEWLRKT